MHFTVPIALSPLASFYPSFLYHLKRTTRRTEPSVLDLENYIWIMSNPCSFLHPNSESQFGSLRSLSCVRFFAIPWTAAYQASLSITTSWSLLKFMSIELVMPFNHFILCRPLLLPSTFSSIRVFSSESVLHIKWPKCWSFSFSIGPSNEYSGLISFRFDWFDLLAPQGTLESLLQNRSSMASILRRSAFFMVQLAHPYMTTEK